MAVTPPRPRSTVESFGGTLRITIPAQRNYFLMLFLAIWLTAWTIAGNAAITSVIKQHDVFLLVWIAGWLFGEVFAVGTLLWMLTGREIIEVSVQSIRLRYQLLGISYPREYLAEHIRNLRVLPTVALPWGYYRRNPWGFGTGVLALDYGAKTYRLAGNIDEAEGGMLLNAIREQFPQYGHVEEKW